VGLRNPASILHADLPPLIQLSGDAAPPSRAVRFLVEAASGGCAFQ
jgi:hypothetical protein